MNSSAAFPHIHELVSGIAAPSRHCRLAALRHACALQTAALPRALRSSDYYCSSWLRCVSSLGRAVAVCMARARDVKMKFAAFTLHLEGMDKTERAAKSSEHAKSMVDLTSSAGPNGTLNGIEKEDVLNSILLTPNRDVWVASDLSRLVAAVEAHGCARRRNSQVYLDNLLFYMLPSEWGKWKANGVQGGENTATTTRTRCTTTRRPPHWHFRTRTWSSADMSRIPMTVFRRSSCAGGKLERVCQRSDLEESTRGTSMA